MTTVLNTTACFRRSNVKLTQGSQVLSSSANVASRTTCIATKKSILSVDFQDSHYSNALPAMIYGYFTPSRCQKFSERTLDLRAIFLRLLEIYPKVRDSTGGKGELYSIKILVAFPQQKQNAAVRVVQQPKV